MGTSFRRGRSDLLVSGIRMELSGERESGENEHLGSIRITFLWWNLHNNLTDRQTFWFADGIGFVRVRVRVYTFSGLVPSPLLASV